MKNIRPILRAIALGAAGLTAFVAANAFAAQARTTASTAAGASIHVPYAPGQPALSVPTVDPGVAAWQQIQTRERRRAILQR